ncbi:MAG: AAA family ATPase [Armatimonadetes bacterium]|nr:AAA family ATPase [Armatimonadota bacterium]
MQMDALRVGATAAPEAPADQEAPGRLLWATELLPAVAPQPGAQGGDPAAGAGLPTGMASLDSLLGGLWPGLYLLEGPPGIGKSTLALQIALSAARVAPVLYVTFENSPADLALRWVASRSRIPLSDLRQGTADAAAVGRVIADSAAEAARLAFIPGNISLTVAALHAAARAALRRHEARRCLMVVDSLPVWAAHGVDVAHCASSADRAEALAILLRELGAALDSPVLGVAAQEMRERESERVSTRLTTPEAVSVSGGLDAVADAVLILTEARTRGEKPPARAIDLVVAKNRRGPSGRVECVFRPDLALVRESMLQRH